jgi:hypothetical protein
VLTVDLYVIGTGSAAWDLVLSFLGAYMVVEVFLFVLRRLPVLGL